MPEVTLRDGMVLVGSLLILAVMIDAWRRMRSQQRERLRVKLAPELPGDVPAEDLTVYRELPNGGARIVSREDLLGSDGLGPSNDNPRILADDDLADAVDAAAAKRAPGEVLSGASKAAREPADNVEASLQGIEEGTEAGTEAGTTESTAEATGVGSPEQEVTFEGMRAENNEPTNLDWLEDIPEHAPAPDESTDDEKARCRQRLLFCMSCRGRDGFPVKTSGDSISL
ncbi:hypothetical protein NOR53_1587 [gamma proteobacterium NOR5-3]|nr:hypothetical protein NOR53_1587 [gamma proteobacterium NOR5-3]